MAAKDIEIRIKVQVTNLQSLQALAAALSQIAAAQKQVTTTAGQKNKAMQKQQQVTRQHQTGVKNLNDTLNNFTRDIKHNITKVLEWALATGVVYGSLRMLRTGIEDVIKVNFAIAGLTKVMGEAGGRSRELASDVQVLASVYGEMGDVLINATTEWARLQISNAEIIQGTTAALLAQAVAEMSVVDATKYLIAELKQFEQPILRAVNLIDQWNELSNTFAVRALDIAQAAARAGSVMHNTGVEMQRLHGYTTALVQSTGRAGTEIGNALRTFGVYAYRMETMGKLAKYADLNITDLTKTQMGLGQILDQLAADWGTYSDQTQKAIAQTMAGTRRTNEFITLMEQYPTALRATVTAWRSVGSAQKEATIFLDTVRKQLDRTASLMQRFVTQGGSLAFVFKTIIGQLNNFIQGLIILKPVIIAATAAIIFMNLNLALMIEKLFRAFLAMATWSAVPFTAMLPAFAAIAVAIAGLISLFGYLEARKEKAIYLAEQLADRSYNDARALRSEADELKVLTKSYESHIKALKRAATEPTLYSPKQTQRMRENLNAIGKELERITGVSFQEFNIDTSNWADALEKVSAKLKDIDERATQAYAEQKASLRVQIEDQKKVIKYYEILEGKIKGRKVAVFPAFRAEQIKEALKESGAAADKVGVSVDWLTGLFKATVDKANEIPEALAKAKAEAADLNLKLKEINEKLYELGTVLSEEDIADILENLSTRLDKIGVYYKFVAAESKFAGDSQTKAAILGLKAIDEQIKTVEDLAKAYKEEDKIQEEAEKTLIGLYKERRRAIYAILEAGWVDNEKKLNDEFKKEIANISSENDYLARYNSEVKGAVAGSQARIQGYKQLISSHEKQIEQYKKLNYDTEDLEDALFKLNLQLKEEEKALANLTQPAEQYARSIDRINLAASRAAVLLRAKGESDIKILRMEVDAAKKRKALATTKEQIEAAEAEYQLAKARLYAAETSDAYVKSIEKVDKALAKDMIFAQKSAANAVAMAERELRAAQEREKIASQYGDAIQKGAREQREMAEWTYQAALMTERATKSERDHQLVIARLTMQQEQEIAALSLLGVTDEEVSAKQVEHARQVAIEVAKSAKAYGGYLNWMYALMDAIRSVRQAENQLASARLEKLREQTRWEFELIQSRHDFELDKMVELNRSVKEQVQARIKHFQREFDFVVYNDKLTKDERIQMAKALYTDLVSAGRDYELEQIRMAANIAEAYVTQYKNIKDQWFATIGAMSTGGPLRALKKQMDEIFAGWFEKKARAKWGGLVERLAGIQLKVAGKSQEELKQEEENRQKMVRALIKGGDYVEDSIKDGITDLGQQIKDWMDAINKMELAGDIKTAFVDGGKEAYSSLIEGGQYIANEIREALGIPKKEYKTEGAEATKQVVGTIVSALVSKMQPAADKSGATMGKYIVESGTVAAEKIGDSIEAATGKTTSNLVDVFMTAYGLLGQMPYKDWFATMEGRKATGAVFARGGGVRMAGYGAGALVGSIVPGIGTLVGAQLGAEITSGLQDLWKWIKAPEVEPKKPITESLREQLSGTISRGQFREAAQITYNVQNTVMMDFFIPDSAQMKRAIPIIKAGLEDYRSNVSVNR